jgi:hypothetical protein
MRSFRSKLYPAALIMFVWAEFGIVRAGLPAGANLPPVESAPATHIGSNPNPTHAITQLINPALESVQIVSAR